MIGYVALLVGLECVLPTAPTPKASPVAPTPAQARQAVPTAARSDVARRSAASAPSDFVITSASRVELNGRPCRFEEVPDEAVITKIVVQEFTGAVVTVHFRTGR
jgi:hypothetical protein